MYLYKLYLHHAKEILCDFRSVYSGEEYFVCFNAGNFVRK